MNAMNQEPNAGGRPPHYTYAQVTSAVRRLEDAGESLETIDEKAVKELLVKEFGVSKGVRDTSLKKYVSAAVLARTEEQNEALVRSLPAEVVTEIETDMGTLHKQMVLTIARQNMTCQRAADQRCEELTEDKQNLRSANLDLKSQLEAQDERIFVLESERDSLLAELNTLRAGLARVEKELEQKATQEAMMADLLAALRSQTP